MWRYVAGAAAALLIAVAGMFYWSGRADTRTLGGTPPPAIGQALDATDIAPPLEAGEKTREARRFSRYDADENGAVSRDEYLASRRKAYARLDLDGDGKISFDEYAARATKKFAGADRDRSGVLTPAEFLSTRVARRALPRGNCPPPLRANADASEDDG